MAFSRVCMTCGVDTAAAVPRFEPRYGLVVVDCAGCGHFWPATRARRDGLWTLFRGQGRLIWWSGALASQAAALVGAGAVIAFLGVSLSDQFGEAGLGPLHLMGLADAPERLRGLPLSARLQEWHDTSGAVVLAGWLLACGAAGAWMGLTMGHLSSRGRGVLLAAAVGLAALVPMSRDAVDVLAQRAGHPTVRGVEPRLDALLAAGTMAMGSGMVSLVGGPVGGVGADVLRGAWRMVRSRRRRRARARRRG